MPSLRSGEAFAGYEIEDVLAKGGMGVVYRARELRPMRTIALKIIIPEHAGDEAFRERFVREAELAAKLEHPNVVPVLRVGEEDGQLFIAMRLIHGQDLARMLTQDGAMPAPRIVAIVDQVADALDMAHSHGLVHRDIKPHNILVEVHRRGDHAYLTDFGLTKSLESVTTLTEAGMMIGTIDYMAPERLEGKPVEAAADIYALGCVLYQGITGQVPFPKESKVARMFAHINEPPPTVTDVVPDAPPALDEVVKRAMAKDPSDRYPTAGELARAALAAVGAPASGGQVPPTTTRPARSERPPASTTVASGGPPGPAQRRGRRRAPLLGAGVLVAAVAVLVAVLASGGSTRRSTSPRSTRPNAGTSGTTGAVTPVATAQRWLAAFNSGQNGEAVSLLRLPFYVETALPDRNRVLVNRVQALSFIAGRGCVLKQLGPVATGPSTVTLTVEAIGQRLEKQAISCGASLRTVYVYEFRIVGGRIDTLRQTLTPYWVVDKWLENNNLARRVSLADQLWAWPATVQTTSSAALVRLQTKADVASYWSAHACALHRVSPISVHGPQATVRVRSGGPPPGSSAVCAPRSVYDDTFTIAQGKIVALSSRPAA